MAKTKHYKFKLRSRRIQLVADKILLLKLFRKMNGRFWGVFGLLILNISLAICFMIRPELRMPETAFSDFGTDPRTSPYFTAGLFASAYGLWRWRNYLSKSSKNPGLITLLLTGTILGLYLIAFMPLGWNETVESLHYIGFAIAGTSMGLTVLVDILLRKTRKSKNQKNWQLIRIGTLVMITCGFILTFLSAKRFGPILEHSLLGESLLLTGFGFWVIVKTYQGDGVQSGFSRALNKVLIVE